MNRIYTINGTNYLLNVSLFYKLNNLFVQHIARVVCAPKHTSGAKRTPYISAYPTILLPLSPDKSMQRDVKLIWACSIRGYTARQGSYIF